MSNCQYCGKRHPNPFDDSCSAKVSQIQKSFFEYFLGFHAIQCTEQGCVCRASTFMDLICEPILRNSKKYGRDIEEVLDRDK